MKTYHTKWYKIEYDEDGEVWDIISGDMNNNCGEIIDSYTNLQTALEHAEYYDIHGHDLVYNR